MKNSTVTNQLETERLILRPWQDSDFPSFQAMNADPKVMAFFPDTLSESESRSLFTAIQQKMQEYGFGAWACEIKATQEVIGFVGLNAPDEEFYFSPCIEIAWRIRAEYQRKGYAKEAALSVLRFAFDTLKLPEIVAFTAIANKPSENLMRSLGMTKMPRNFHHPQLPITHPLSEHVVYSIKAPHNSSSNSDHDI